MMGPTLYLAYGRDDCEIWIATLDKNALMSTLVPLFTKTNDIFESALRNE